MKKKVLIVDDDSSIVDMLSILFWRKGFTVLAAYDGVSGLNTAKEKAPDVIVLDLMLPRLSGEEVCRQIRKDGVIGKTPIVMISGKASDADRIIGKVIGADSYFSKPFDINVLVKEIDSLLH